MRFFMSSMLILSIIICGCSSDDEIVILPTLSVDDVVMAEGDSGTTAFSFTVTLSEVTGLDVTFDVATVDDTATITDSDYTLVSTSGIIASGNTSTTIVVLVTGDENYEWDEYFNVVISNPTNATMSDDTGTGTITNDDSQPSISINDISAEEGLSGTQTFDFTVSLSATSIDTVSFNYNSYNGTASSINGDYVSTNGGGTITPGNTTYTISVTVNGDAIVEPDETFTVELTSPNNATILDPSGTGTILDDDAASIIYVDSTGDNSDGMTWEKAKNTIQEGISEANSRGAAEVWVAANTYTNSSGSGSLVTMRDGISVYGGFEGYNSGSGAQESNITDQNPSVNITTIDGNSVDASVVIAASNCMLRGFTITGGNKITMTTGGGGGLYASNTVTNFDIYNCIFEANSESNFGGGAIHYWYATGTISNCTFRNNSAPAYGAINTQGGPVSIIDCTFDQNISNGYGGGVGASDCDLTVRGCTFTDNTGNGLFFEVNNDIHNLIVDNCEFYGNVSNSSGGGLYISSASDRSAYITNCIINGNSAAWGGGGAYVSGTTTVFANCVFSGNTATESFADGGGLSASGTPDLKIVNCTFANNSTEDTGDGIYIGASCTVACSNTILWNGSVDEYAVDATSTLTFSHCNVQGAAPAGTKNISSDPGFVSILGADATAGTADDNLRPTAEIVLDAGDNSEVPLDYTDVDGDLNTSETLPLDLDGANRFAENAAANSGTGTAPLVDMGAYEVP